MSILRWSIGIAVALAVILGSVSPGLAGETRVIKYEGHLDSSTDRPVVDGVYKIWFDLFADEVGGTPLWAEVQSIEVTGGSFTAALGSVEAIDLASGDYWLQIFTEGHSSKKRARVRLATQALTLDGNLDVIGDLEVIGASRIRQGNVALLHFVDESSQSARISLGWSSGSALMATVNADPYRLISLYPIGIGASSMEPRTGLEIEGRGGLRVTSETLSYVYGDIRHDASGGMIINSRAGGGWADIRIQTDGVNRLFVESAGNVGIGTTNPLGKLDVNGTIYQRGGQLHADYVFEDDYELASIEEHARFMWEEKHLEGLPARSQDETGQEVVEVGAHRKGIVEELEKAHIYIEQLNEQLKALEGRLQSLEGDAQCSG